MNRNTQIVINDDLLRKIVYCIEKAIGDDLQQYLRENHRETSITQIKLLIVSVSGIMNLINTFYGGQLCQHYLIV